MSFSVIGSFVKRESRLQCNLPLHHLAVINLAARLGDLHPSNIADGL